MNSPIQTILCDKFYLNVHFRDEEIDTEMSNILSRVTQPIIGREHLKNPAL
jgi:hypothetical protein